MITHNFWMVLMHKAIVVVAEGVEEMEAVTAIDILRRAGMRVDVLGLSRDNIVQGSRGVLLLSETCLTGDEEADLLVLPGGAEGARRLAEDERVVKMLGQFALQDRWIGAICAAPIALAAAGLLSDRTATGHPSVQSELETAGAIYSERSVVVDGRIVTGRGPAVSMEFALKLVELVVGADKASEVRAPMMFPS